MHTVHHVTQWVKGEVMQGRIMFSLGILSLIAFFYIANLHHAFFKGLIVPVLLLQIILLGYGGFQLFKRPSYIEKVRIENQLNPSNAHRIELEKAQKDDKIYGILKPIWALLFVVSMVLFVVLKEDFAKGMSIGFALWFVTAFVCDWFLHHRLKTFLAALQQLN